MGGTLKLQAGAAATTLQDGTSLALSNAAAVRLATADFDNTANLGFAIDVELDTNGWGATSGIAGKTIDFYAVPSLDGTNFGEVDTSTPNIPADAYRRSFEIIDTNNIQRLIVEGIPVGPYKYRCYIQNNSGQQMSAGWSVSARYSTEQY